MGRAQRTEIITLNGHSFSVKSNFIDALSNIREVFSKGDLRKEPNFWIDAVCVDQSNSKERGEQVSRMEEIFPRSNRVGIRRHIP
jgi:Heterokaryon incompatibility protein (HET)